MVSSAGEGCGVVVLKRMSEAVRGGDRILAVMRGSAVNQDGRSSGLTAPNGAAQEALLRAALADARLSPADIDCIEAHGTGTALGDPIEAHALAAVFAADRPPSRPLVVGSVKTNIGHLEAAAGIAGLIKTVLALEHEYIPKHLHFRSMNPHIDWGGLAVEIPSEGRAWPRGERVRRAGVSSFGFSGTNAHLIVEEAPLPALRQPQWQRDWHLLTLSARTPAALEELTARYRQELADTTAGLSDICFTASAGRTHFEERAFYLGRDREQMLAALAQAAPRGRQEGTPPLAFLFSGQGAQYAGMGRELYRSQPVFRRVMDQCAEMLREELEEPLPEVLWGAHTGLLNQTAYTQPALFALEYALAETWRSWGIEPAMVAGHSVGEYVAACVAGVFPLEAGLHLIAARGRLMQHCAGRGVMSAFRTGAAPVLQALEGYESRVALAAINAPESVVIAGYEAEVAEVEKRLAGQGVPAKRLAVSHGFHSPQMDEITAAFEQVAAKFQYRAPAVQWISAMTGQPVGSERVDARYWRDQLRQPVQWARAMAAMETGQPAVYLEAGPGTTLLGLGRQCVTTSDRHWLPSLRSGRDEWQQMLDTLGTLYLRGLDPDWNAFHQHSLPTRVPLPAYPFQSRRFWIVAAEPRRPKVSASDPPSDWFYRVLWQHKAATVDAAQTKPAQRWLVVPDRAGVAEAFETAIGSLGGSARIVQLHEAVDVLRTQPFDCVLYLGALNGPLNDDFGLSSSSDPIASTSAEILQITQSCIEHRRPLWLVTRGAQAVLDDERDVNLAQSHVWGWAKTVALEHPEAWGGIVDLEPSTSQVASARVLVIAMVLATADDEDQIAFRNGERYVPRLHRAAAPPAASAPLATDKLYLITGGLGGIGLRLARWMAQRGARHLLLVSRTGLPDRSVWGEVDGDTTVARQISAIREIENLGADVSLRKLDICDRDLVRSLFATLPRELGGILHLAAAGEFSSLSNMTEAAVRAVMSPKTIGTWNLHDASKNLPIDFFVLFSSWAAVLGAENLAHYNAANQFLDAFAYYRRSQNLCATVVNWGTWDILRHASDAMRMGFERSGMKPLASDAAFTAMFRTVAAGTTQAIVANVDWQNLKPLYESRRPRPFLEAASNLPADLSSPNLLAHPVAQETQQPEKPPQSISPAIRNVLAAIPLQQRIPKLIAWVIETLSSVLRISSPELTASSQTGELGMDSLMALDVRRRIQSEFEIVIPISLLVEGVTVAELASRIASALPDPVSGHIQETGTIATVEDALPVESFPLSHIQRAGWVNLKLIPDAGIFQVGFAAEASPPLQWEAFKRAVWRLMELHAALRTVFFETAEGEPQQRVLPSWKPETTLIHVPGLTDDEIAEVVTREHRKAFNVEESVLRITVFRRAQTDIAVISVHHLAVDASSMGFCIEDLAKLYAAELGTDSPLPIPPQSTYREFVEQETKLLEDPSSERLWEYWKKQLSGELPLLQLPCSRPRSDLFAFPIGDGISIPTPPHFSNAVSQAARRMRLTRYSLLLAAYQALLTRYSRQTDLIVGTASSIRELERWSRTVGYLVNILSIRCNVSDDPTFADHATRTREAVLAALDHQGLPFSLMVERLRIRSRRGRSPVFQSFFNLNTDPGNLAPLYTGIGDCAVPFGNSFLRPRFTIPPHYAGGEGMGLVIIDSGGKLTTNLTYHADFVDPAVAAMMVTDYVKIVEAVMQDPQIRLSELPISYAPQEDPSEELLL